MTIPLEIETEIRYIYYLFAELIQDIENPFSSLVHILT